MNENIAFPECPPPFTMGAMSGKEKSVDIQPELIMNLHWGFARSQVLTTAMELDIFSQIHSGKTNVEKVARAIRSPLRSTRIFLDALVGMGLLGKTRGAYKLVPESKAFLVKGESNFLGNFLLNIDGHCKYWAQLTKSVRMGKPIEDNSTPEQRTAFFKDLVKGIFSTSFASAVILGKKLGIGKSLKGNKILDLGCGAAAWSLAFALADQNAQIVAVDFPEVLEVAQNYVKRLRATKQYEFQGGDYHELDLGKADYDIIILGHICHMEGEAGSRKLIKRCYDALKPGGKLLVAEFVANDLKTGPEIPLMFALNMILFTEQGDVFSTKEIKRWLNLAGFKKVSAQAVQYPVTVVVATK